MRKNSERKVLMVSAISAACFSISGLILGLLSGSVMILFDSAYSLLSLALASLSLLALKLANQPANNDYPFGRLTIEPIAILVKGVVIALVCFVSMIFAVVSLLQGGREVNLDLALVFGVVNVIGCAITWAYIKRRKKDVKTSLVDAEQRQWQMDTWLSTAVLLGFIATFVIIHTPYADYARYADPLMVLIISGYFSYIPVRMIAQALRQILFAAPTDDLRAQIDAQLTTSGVQPHKPLRIAQVGSFLIAQLPARLDANVHELMHIAINEIAEQQQLKLLLVQGVHIQQD
ncbi:MULTISPECIES: cation diffusion facilitator family transporter [unclassified Methylophaga]|uniref:cation diffusion facilitator family transporter n=1 Tax=unclassified Methylophaga TaxID=2629249 RepID=UPI000C8E633F|nr:MULTISPECIES: cation diffusion facilitator family transporter [unclassified Methylophaga]MAK67357.1 cation transporter [Methylophaga sp.]MAY16896.1 cation transporter [Methylophaga sp.]HAO25149.1 cation transporter [Methylophaga sp.]HCD05099.1 cation transporter [Methylophaga sp.]